MEEDRKRTIYEKVILDAFIVYRKQSQKGNFYVHHRDRADYFHLIISTLKAQGFTKEDVDQFAFKKKIESISRFAGLYKMDNGFRDEVQQQLENAILTVFVDSVELVSEPEKAPILKVQKKSDLPEPESKTVKAYENRTSSPQQTDKPEHLKKYDKKYSDPKYILTHLDLPPVDKSLLPQVETTPLTDHDEFMAELGLKDDE